ncbi:MAG: hypothetical protein J0G96_01525 [Flavobacteriia bacterium]|nr:hypothetical protein [Flavobacteriia bacterium]OJX38580.1 MAG: hypothetical protein BGO87_10750 [Flavobacteriia bacterium 40-80]
MRKLSFLIPVLLSVLLFSCKNNEPTENAAQNDTEEMYLYNKQDTLAAIDFALDTSNCVQYSLDYSKENNERYFASLYCDVKGNVLRMEELIISPEQLYQKNKFYYDNKRIFATVCEYQEKEDTSLIFIEELNFYNVKGDVEKSFRKVTRDNAKEEANFILSEKNKKLSNERIFRAVNNEGEFELTFQGIIKTDNLDYLLIGSPEKDGYTTALQIEANTPFIKDIYVNERRYINRKIGVNFERQSMSNFSYQVFVAGKWLD